MKYAQDYHMLPIKASVDAGSTDVGTEWFNMRDYNWADVLVNMGAITGDTLVVTVEESTTNSSGAEVAIPFVYRLSSAVATDSLGAATTCDSGGVTVAATDDNKTLVVSIDPQSLDEGYNYARLWFNLGGSMSAFLVGANAILTPRYPSATAISAT